jgi:hypothetical protein
MRSTIRMMALGLLSISLGWAQDEPVARVQAIKATAQGASPLLKQKRPTDAQPFPVSVHSTGYIKDRYITDNNTIATLEFLIGGRVAISKGADIEIINEHSVADSKVSVKRIVMKTGTLWVKADAKQLKQPLEIQTAGGVMGIKGTEFTVDANPSGNVEVCCFESNSSQGGVELRDSSGKVVSLVKPGDEVTIQDWKKAPVVKNSGDINGLRSSKSQQYFGNEATTVIDWMNRPIPVFGSLSNMAFWMGDGGTVSQIVSYAGAVIQIVNNPAQAGVDFATSYANSRIPGPFGIPSFSVGGGKSDPDFPTQLVPDAQQGSGQASSRPSFSWKGVDGSDGYVVLVAKDEDCGEVVYSTRTSGTQLAYPSDHRPLAPGKYFWRIIPVDAQDKPTEAKGSQTYFTVGS